MYLVIIDTLCSTLRWSFVSLSLIILLFLFTNSKTKYCPTTHVIVMEIYRAIVQEVATWLETRSEILIVDISTNRTAIMIDKIIVLAYTEENRDLFGIIT